MRDLLVPNSVHCLVYRNFGEWKLLGRIGWTTSDIVVLSEHFHVSTDYLLGFDTDHEEVA